MTEFGNAGVAGAAGVQQCESPTPARIKSVTIEGFRCLRSIRALELPQLAVLIGANGSGKSTLMRFFEMLGWMLKSRNLQEFVIRNGGGDDQFFMGARQTRSIHAELRLETASGMNDYRFDMEHVFSGDKVMLLNEAYRYSAHKYSTEVSWTKIGSPNWESGLLNETNKTAKTIIYFLRQCAVYQFHDTSLHAAIHNRWDVSDSFRLRSDGGNLAPILLHLRETDRERYDLIVWQIRRVLPIFKDFVLEEEQGTVLLRWLGTQSDKVFGSHLTSDGSLRAFCLLTLLNLPPERLPDVMLFDEPELGLHPHAIELVAAMFKRLAHKRQIVIATQSPHLVDCFNLENIIIANADNGETTLQLLPRERYQEWLDNEYMLSDIWLSQVMEGIA